jgi:hypothetical protein
MAVFISVTTNAFEETFAGQTASRNENNRRDYANVRRPLRGIEIKEDTYAIIKVLDFLGSDIPLISSSAPGGEADVGFDHSYSNFIIQQITEQRVEKQQIVETFGEDFIFFFGERPRFLTVNGILMNTNDFNWKSEFWENYENYLRGTKLVEQNARMYLFWDDVVVEGYMLQANATADTNMPYHLPFQFQFFVTNYAIISQVGATVSPRRGKIGVSAVDFSEQLRGGGQISTTVAVEAQNLPGNVGPQSQGGLHSFLASTASFATDATFSIQNTLENIKNTFFGRAINIPQGIGNQVVRVPIENQASFNHPPRGAISANLDEYPENSGFTPEYDDEEVERVAGLLRLDSGEELEKEARAALAARGIDVTNRNANALLLGRAAFAGLQTFGSFGIQQADGGIVSLL